MMLSKGDQAGRFGKAGKSQKKRSAAYKKVSKKKRTPKISERGIEQSEAGLQVQCEEYLDLLNLRWIHVPDVIGRLCCHSDQRVTITDKELLSFYFKDLPDLIIFENAGPHPSVLAIELKVGRNRESAGQREYLKYMYGDLWDAQVIYTYDEFRHAVDRFREVCSQMRANFFQKMD